MLASYRPRIRLRRRSEVREHLVNAVTHLLSHVPFDRAVRFQHLWMTSGGLTIMFAGVIAALRSGRPSSGGRRESGATEPPDGTDLSG
jgi:hypothetical protein